MSQIVSRAVALYLTISLCLYLLFVEKKRTTLVCKDIEIAIKDYPGQSFMTLQSTHRIFFKKPPSYNRCICL